MNGIINVLKPSGMSSHDVVAYIRKTIGIKKVGHSGTLDPSAVGVLPVFIGKATKAVSYAIEETKSYRTEMKLGVITDTGDKDGKEIAVDDWKKYINEEEYYSNIDSILKSFKGKYAQIPPMYSAIKVNGQKLYNMARQGKEIDRPPREVEINRIEIISCDYNEGLILFDVDCSKGTYIRVLCEDIGKKIGCGAHMSYLIRTQSSKFNIKNSYTLEEIKTAYEKNLLSEIIMPVSELFNIYEKQVITDKNSLAKLMNGCYIEIKEIGINNTGNEVVALYSEHEFIGLADIFKENDKTYLKVKKFFV
ncbi:MAG: tRNA pseudouridine(55) synthase TruB [Ignavibacteriales bacterium]